MMRIDINRVMEIINDGNNITETAALYADETDQPFDGTFRRKISYHVKNYRDKKKNVEHKFTENIEMSTLSAIKLDGNIMTIDEYCEFYGIPASDVKSYKLVNHTNKAYYNIQSKDLGKVVNFDALLSQITNSLSTIEKPKTIERSISGDHLLFIDPADIHIGKLASAFEVGKDDEYDPTIAYNRVHQGIDTVISSAKPYNASKVLFVIGNDILHTDNTKRTTTAGTPQDTSGMWYENFLLAKKLYIEILLKLIDIADVHVQFNPSNHDYMSGFMLAEVIKTYFKECANVTFDTDMSYRKYYKFGTNLIGTTHGDQGKTSDYPLAMAHEASEHWSNTKHRYFYTHHVHSKSAQDYMSVQVESLRSVSGADSWHHRNMYQHAPKTISCMVHHIDKGKVATLSHTF